MRIVNLVFGVLAALLPILYCAALVYYFVSISGSLEDAKHIGLGPTIYSLTGLGILFLIVFIWKIVRLIFRRGANKSGGGNGPRTPPKGSAKTVDADAIIAKYMAERAPTASPNPFQSQSMLPGGPSGQGSTFGRKPS